jgi:hypothetical protein
MHLTNLFAAALFATATTAQTITLAEGTPTSLSIVTVAEAAPNGGDTIVLQDVELLDLELTGRTLAQESDPHVTRRVVLQGIARAELPGGGRVFRYRRASGAFWGFLHVAADGTPRVVLETHGVGTTQRSDPFFDRIAIAADGLHAAIAFAAGGLRIVRLDGGTYAGTGRADWIAAPAQVDVNDTATRIGSSFVFYQSGQPDQVWRCALAEGSVPVDVSPPAQANAILKNEMALSGDGTHCVYLYGPQHQQRLWLVGPNGGPTLLPPAASKYEEPNYLPEGAGEPAMLLNDDGSRLFFIDADVRDELFLLDTTGALPPLQITEDAIFEPYIGAHILPRFAAGKLTVAIGDIATMDWFQVQLGATGGSVTNLTGTGSLTQPFLPGAIDPVTAVDAGTYLLVTEHLPGGMTLRRVDPATGAQAIVQQGVLASPTAGASTQGTADLVVRTTAGDTLVSGLTGIAVATLPPDLLLTPIVQGPDFAGTWLHLTAGFGATAYYLPDGTIAFGQIDFALQQLVLTAAGGALELGSTLRYLAPGTSAVLNRPAAATRLLLSGVGN